MGTVTLWTCRSCGEIYKKERETCSECGNPTLEMRLRLDPDMAYPCVVFKPSKAEPSTVNGREGKRRGKRAEGIEGKQGQGTEK